MNSVTIIGPTRWASRSFVDNFGTGADFKRWVRPSSGEEFFVKKSTRELAIKVGTGPEAGALKTYYRRHPGRDLEAWARSNGFTGSW